MNCYKQLVSQQAEFVFLPSTAEQQQVLASPTLNPHQSILTQNFILPSQSTATYPVQLATNGSQINHHVQGIQDNFLFHPSITTIPYIHGVQQISCLHPRLNHQVLPTTTSTAQMIQANQLQVLAPRQPSAQQQLQLSHHSKLDPLQNTPTQHRNILRAKRRSVNQQQNHEILNPSILSQPNSGLFKEILKTPMYSNKRLIDNVDDVVHGSQSKRAATTAIGGVRNDIVMAATLTPKIVHYHPPQTSLQQVFKPENQVTTASLVTKVMRTVEHYFCNENLSKNAYLLKHIMQDKEGGYMSVRKVAALKRVKSLTRDVNIVNEAIQMSNKLELSADTMKMRRKDNTLPSNIEVQQCARKLIAINLPLETPTVESVTGLFSKYGELTQVCVLKPGVEPPQRLRSFKMYVPDLGVKYCAEVEFISIDSAQKACREINMQNREANQFRVALLKGGSRLKRTLYRVYKDENEQARASSPSSNNDTASTTSSPKFNVANDE